MFPGGHLPPASHRPASGSIGYRQVFDRVARIYKEASVTLIRPGILKMPVFDAVSTIFSHSQEINRQIIEFMPDVIVGFGILNNYLAIYYII